MDLLSVRKLKDEARKQLASIKLPLFLLEPAKRWITLGIGRKDDGGFHLTVRVRTLLFDPLLEIEITRHLSLIGVGPMDFDLRHTGPVLALQPAGPAEQSARLTIGSSISHIDTLGGTLGFFAKSRLDGKTGLVSANHVIGNVDQAKAGDPIVSPGGDKKNPKVAEFVRSVPLGGGGEKLVDAAFAELVTNNFDASTLPDGTLLSQIAAPEESTAVRKFGSHSKLRHGHVTSFNQDDFETLEFAGLGAVTFDDQIEVASDDLIHPFARDGDSGSLVYNANFRAVGLLFGMAKGFAYVNPMKKVLDLLNVDLLTT